MNKSKLKELLRTIDEGILNETIDLPDNALLSLPESTVLFTKKRLELMDIIRRKRPQSVQELALLTKRVKQAVTRDLRILQRFEVVRLEKKGRKVIPRIQRELIVLAIPPQSFHYSTKIMLAEA